MRVLNPPDPAVREDDDRFCRRCEVGVEPSCFHGEPRRRRRRHTQRLLVDVVLAD